MKTEDGLKAKIHDLNFVLNIKTDEFEQKFSEFEQSYYSLIDEYSKIKNENIDLKQLAGDIPFENFTEMCKALSCLNKEIWMINDKCNQFLGTITKYIESAWVIKITIENDYDIIVETTFDNYVRYKDFGKTWFYTEAEAREKLER